MNMLEHVHAAYYHIGGSGLNVLHATYTTLTTTTVPIPPSRKRTATESRRALRISELPSVINLVRYPKP